MNKPCSAPAHMTASRETLERLAEAIDLRMRNKDSDLDGCLERYRAEIAPRLRTRAEVDAEIVRVARVYSGSQREPDHNWLLRLCAEPTAPDSGYRCGPCESHGISNSAGHAGPCPGDTPAPRQLDRPEIDRIAGELQQFDMSVFPRYPGLTSLVRQLLKVLE